MVQLQGRRSKSGGGRSVSAGFVRFCVIAEKSGYLCALQYLEKARAAILEARRWRGLVP